MQNSLPSTSHVQSMYECLTNSSKNSVIDIWSGIMKSLEMTNQSIPFVCLSLPHIRSHVPETKSFDFSVPCGTKRAIVTSTCDSTDESVKARTQPETRWCLGTAIKKGRKGRRHYNNKKALNSKNHSDKICLPQIVAGGKMFAITG